MFVLRQPGAAELAAFLARAERMPLTYPVGLAREPAPPGFRVAEERAVLGHGRAVYERATQLLSEWRQFDLGWAGIYPRSGPLTTGTNVVVIARHVGLWSLNACRVVYTLSQDAGRLAGGEPRGDVFGFAYGTLSDHAETGEEIFRVSFDATTGEVTYVIRAVSRERALLARLGAPVARAFQDRFRRDSVAAMQRQMQASSVITRPATGR